MVLITSRKHAQSRFTHHMSTALAVMLLPVAAQAAPSANQTLQEIKVVESAESPFKAEKAASPKYTEKLLDTAQSITVIKKELIEQQGAVTLTEALRNTPGVGTFFLGENGSTSTGDAIYMRGFDSSGSIYVDGVRDVGSISRDVFNIEQVDVLKGPAGTDNGRSSPTGAINLVSKQATLENVFYSSLTLGSGAQKRVSADWNKVINADSGSAFRLNLLDQDSGNPARDTVKNKRWAVAPTLAFGLNGPTRLYLDLLHVQQDNLPDGGVPTIGLPGYTSPDPARAYIGAAPAVDPRNFYGSNADFDQVKADMLTVRVEHDVSPALKLQNITRHGKTTQNYLLTSFMASTANLSTPSGLSGLADWTVARGTGKTFTPTIKDQQNEILTNQSTVTARFDTGALRHTVVGGLELTNEKQTTHGYSVSAKLPAAKLYHPDANIAIGALNPRRNGVRNDGSTNTQSLYGFDTLKLGEQWVFNGGLRLDRYSTTYSALALPTAPATALVPTALDLSDTLVNGKLSALYKPSANSSVYALIATSKLPPGGSNFALSTDVKSAANPKFDAQKTVTRELGGKWDFLRQKLSLTAALYRTEVSNEVELDPIDLQYYQSGKKRVQGIELGATGEILRNWLVSAGYARMDTSVVAGAKVGNSGADGLNYTPKQAFTAWTSYTMASGLTLGGGARFVDSLMRGKDGAIGTPAYTEAYWVVDAMASYRVNKHLDLRLNLYNLADKAYVASINKSGYRYTPGAPRSGSLSANFTF